MRPDAELRLPAEAAFVSVLRATAVSLAARLDFTVDDLEDLRMAVSEAAGLVLEQTASDGMLTTGFSIEPGRLTVRVSAPSASPAPVEREDFAWQVLSALTVDATSAIEDEHLVVAFTIATLAGM